MSGTVAVEPSTSTTLSLEQIDPIDMLMEAVSDPAPHEAASTVGSPDFGAADRISAEFAEAGIPEGTVVISVLPVTGTDERLLVLTADPSAGEADIEGDADLFELLVASPAVADAKVTRVVLHYFDTDEEGDFVFTMTLPMVALAAYVNDDADVRDQAQAQLLRLEGTTP